MITATTVASPDMSIYWRYQKRSWWAWAARLVILALVCLGMYMPIMLAFGWDGDLCGGYGALLGFAIIVTVVFVVPVAGWLFDAFAHRSTRLESARAPTDQTPPTYRGPSRLSSLGHAILFACAMTGLWFASGILAKASYLTHELGTHLPPIVDHACALGSPLYGALLTLAFIGLALLLVALLRHGPQRFVVACSLALPVYAGSLACTSIYLLCNGGVAHICAYRDQSYVSTVYKRMIEDLIVVDAAQGRYECARETVRKLCGPNTGIDFSEVNAASDFTYSEVSARIRSLERALPRMTNTVERMRILATLSLFQDRIRTQYSRNRAESDLALNAPRYAAEAGAPVTNSYFDALGWIAGNLNRGGWDPLPPFRLEHNPAPEPRRR